MQIYSCIYLYALGHALIKQTMYTNIDFIFCFNFFFSLNQKKKILKGYKLPPCSSLINTPRSTKRVEGDVDTIVYFPKTDTIECEVSDLPPDKNIVNNSLPLLINRHLN